jgi:hypothetical protein
MSYVEFRMLPDYSAVCASSAMELIETRVQTPGSGSHFAFSFFVCPPEGGLGSSWLKHALKQRPSTTLLGVVSFFVTVCDQDAVTEPIRKSRG